jgi:hypothetical protein
MTKLTEGNMRTVLDIIAVKPALGPAAKAIGGAPGLLFEWLRQSSQGSEKTMVRWPNLESEPIQFREAVNLARKYFIVMWESQIRDEVANGVPREIVHDGKLMFKEEEALINLTDKELADLGIRDRWARDEDGNRIPATYREPASAHLKIRAAASLMPLAWGERRHISVDQNISGGVLVMQGAKPPSLAVHSAPEALPKANPDETIYKRADGSFVVVKNTPAPERHLVPPAAPLSVVAEQHDDGLSDEQRKLLAKLDAMEQTPMVQDFRRRCLAGVQNPTPKNLDELPKAPRMDDPPDDLTPGR